MNKAMFVFQRGGKWKSFQGADLKSRGVKATADDLRQIRFSAVAHSQDALMFLLAALYSEIWAATEGGAGGGRRVRTRRLLLWITLDLRKKWKQKLQIESDYARLHTELPRCCLSQNLNSWMATFSLFFRFFLVHIIEVTYSNSNLQFN